MSKRIHIAAAAKQLTRTLFGNMPVEGVVLAQQDNLEVQVHGAWPKDKVEKFAGYAVAWREAAVG